MKNKYFSITQVRRRLSLMSLMLFVFFALHENVSAQTGSFDSTGVWHEINDGFRSCPPVGEYGGVNSAFNEKFEVFLLLHRRGLMYALVTYQYGCPPSLYEFDTIVNRWRCVARIDQDMNVLYQYNEGSDVEYHFNMLSNGNDIVLINSKSGINTNGAMVWRFTKEYENHPNGWEVISTNQNLTVAKAKTLRNQFGETMHEVAADSCLHECWREDDDGARDMIFPALRANTSSRTRTQNLSFVGNSIYAVAIIDTAYDDLHFRVLRFDLPTLQGNKSSWTAMDLPPAPVPEDWYEERDGVIFPQQDDLGLTVQFTQPIAGLFSIHIAMMEKIQTDGYAPHWIHTYDPRDHSWIDLSKGIDDRGHLRLSSSWDNQRLLVRMGNGGLREWTGYGWKLLSTIGGVPIVTTNGVLFSPNYDGAMPVYRDGPDEVVLKNPVPPDPNTFWKDYVIDPERLYTKLQTPDDGRTWFATQKIKGFSHDDYDYDEDDVQDLYKLYYDDDYYKGMYIYKIDQKTSRLTYNLHVQHSSYIGGGGPFANLAVGVAVTPEEEILVAGTFNGVEGNLHPDFDDNTFTIPEADGMEMGRIIRMNKRADLILGSVILGDEVHYFDRRRGGDDRIVVSGSWGVTCLNARGDSVIWTLPASNFSHGGNTSGYLKVDIDDHTGKVVVMRNDSSFRNNEASYMNNEGNLVAGSMWLVDSDGEINTSMGALNPGFTYFQDVAIYKDTIVAGGRDGVEGRLTYYDVSSSAWDLHLQHTYPKDSLRNVHKIDFMKDAVLHVLGGRGNNDDNNKASYLQVNHRTDDVLYFDEISGVDTDMGALHQTDEGFLHLGGRWRDNPDDRLSAISGEMQGDYTWLESAYQILDMRYDSKVLFDGGFNRMEGKGSVYDVDSRTFGSGVNERQVIAGIGISHAGNWITGKYHEYDTTYHLWKFSADEAMHKDPLAFDMNSLVFTHRNPPWKESHEDSVQYQYLPGDTILCPGTENVGLDLEVLLDGEVVENKSIDLCTGQNIQVVNKTNPDFMEDPTEIYWSFGTDANVPDNMQDGSGGPYNINWSLSGQKEIHMWGNVVAQLWDKDSETCVPVATTDSVNSAMKSIYINVVDPDDVLLNGPIDGVFSAVCPGSVIPFSIPPVDAVSKYNWQLPNADWEIIGNEHSNTVQIFIGRGSGDVSVTGSVATCGAQTEPLSSYVNTIGDDNDVLYVASDGKFIIDDLDSNYVNVPNPARLIGVWKHDGTASEDMSAWKKYNYIDHGWGLSGQINAVAKGADGFMYIYSKQNGLSKFDGENYTSYLWSSGSPANTPHEPDRRAMRDKMQVGPDGNLWMCNQEDWGAIYKLDEDEDRILRQGFQKREVTGFDWDSQERLWISLKSTDTATRNQGGLVRIDDPGSLDWDADWIEGVDYEVYNQANSDLPTNSVQGVMIDSDDNVWVILNGGLFPLDPDPMDFVARFDGSSWQSWVARPGNYEDPVSIIEDADGNIWVGNGDGRENIIGDGGARGVFKYDGSNWTHYLEGTLCHDCDDINELNVNYVPKMEVDSEGNIYFLRFALYGKRPVGITKFDGTTWTQFSPPHTSFDGPYRARGQAVSMALDDNDELWLGTIRGGKWEFSQLGNTYNEIGYTTRASDTTQFQFIPDLRDAGEYEVYVKFPSTNAGPYNYIYDQLHEISVVYDGGTAHFHTANDMEWPILTGQWYRLGTTFPFDAGTDGYVEYLGGSPDVVMFKKVEEGYSPYDSMMVEKIENMDYNVTIVPDSEFSIDQLTCTRAVFISPTAYKGNIPDEISTYEIPVITSSPEAFEVLRYIGNNRLDRGTTSEKDQIFVADSGHELLSGIDTLTPTVYSVPSNMAWANPGGNPDTIASYDGTRWSHFAYEKGSLMTGITASDRQVGLFFYDNPLITDYASLLTPEADSILFYAVCWVLRDCPGYQTITLDSTYFEACPREQIVLPFTVEGEGEYTEFNPGNEFIVRLSNKYGEFSGVGVYKEVGRVSGTSSGQVVVTLPEDVRPSDEDIYKIRIESTSPSMMSENVAEIKIHPLPSGIGQIDGNTGFCTGEPEIFELTGISDFEPEMFEWVLPEDAFADPLYADDSISDGRLYTKYELVKVTLTEDFNPLSDGKLRVRIKDKTCGWGLEDDYTEVTLERYSVPLPVDTADIGIGYPKKAPGDLVILTVVDREEYRADDYKWFYPDWIEMEGSTGLGLTGYVHDTVSHGLSDTIWVQGINHCGKGPKKYKIVTIDTTRLTLGMDSIIGPKQVCKGSRYWYSYEPGYLGANYSWILPSGVSAENVNGNQAELFFSVAIPEGMIIAQCGLVTDTLYFTMQTETNVLLITGDGTLDVPTDQWMHDRLLSESVRKYIDFDSVVVKADHEEVCPLMDCYELIIVSTTATADIPGEYNSARVPVIINNTDLLSHTNGFGLAAEGGVVAYPKTTISEPTKELHIFDNLHAITSQHPIGIVQVYDSAGGALGGAGSLDWSIPDRNYPNAHSFAYGSFINNYTAREDAYTSISYLRDEMMMGGIDGNSWIAEGKRLSFFLADSTATLSDDGKELFDRAVCWATNTCDTSLRIQTAELGDDEYCLGDEVKVLFETFPPEVEFNADNTFQVELSDQNGFFLNPIVIGSKDAVNASAATFEIEAQFPADFVESCIQGGTNYRVRVSSTSPAIIGGMNGEGAGMQQDIKLETCLSKNYDTIRIYSGMDTTRNIEFCGFICDSIRGLSQEGALRFGGWTFLDMGSSFSGDLVGTPLTLETWIVSDEYQQADENQVLFSAFTSGGDLRYALYIDKNGRVSFREGPGEQDNHISSSNVLDNNNPQHPKHHHIAMVLDPIDANSSNLRIYVDGLERLNRDIVDVSGEEPGRAQANDIWYIGSAGSDQFFNGIMSDARIWNTARSFDELNFYKNECPSFSTPGLVALYQFSDGSGTTVSDATENNHNGSIWGGSHEWLSGKDVPCGSNIQNYYFFPQLSGPAGSYTAQSISLPDTLSMTDADLCAGGNQNLVARITSGNLINNGFYKYRMMAYNIDKGLSTPYDVYEEIIRVKVRPESYIVPSETYVKGLDCYGSTDSLDGKVRFTFNFAGDSIWLPITYYWTKPDGTTDTNVVGSDWQEAQRVYSDLEIGVYTLKIVDDLGFTDTHEFDLGEPDPIELGDYTINDVLCHGDKNGAIVLDVIGGTPGITGYSYSWVSQEVLHFPNTDSIVNLPTGYYHVTIEDRNNCMAEFDSFFVDEPPLFEIVNELSYTEDVSAQGLNDGAIHIAVTGGVSPYSSVHDSLALNVTDQPDQHFSFTNLYAGFYDSIYLIDDNGCEIITSYEVYDSGAMRIDSVMMETVTCNGGSDGSVWVRVTGGDFPATIINDTAGIWTTVDDSTFFADNLSAGDHVFRVEDQSGASQQRTYSLTSPDPLSVSADITHIEIGVIDMGEIIVQVSGGVGPFDFFWDHGDTVYARDARRDTVQDLPEGDYQLTVRDANFCERTFDFKIVEIDSILINPLTASVNKFDVSCHGFNNGYAEAVGNDGFPDYQYEWSTGATTKTIDGLQPGLYYVTITDAFYNVEVAQTRIQEPTPLSITGDVESPTCDAAFGSIEIEVTGGTRPYKSVEWNTGDTTLVLNDIASGIYSVTVVDDNDCEVEESFTLADFGTELVLDTLVKRPYCFESADGRIEILVSGGTPLNNGDYEYEWSYSGVVQDPVIEGGLGTNLDNGRYFVTVTDKNNCDAEITIILDYLHEECLLIASGFTPNGDGINDYWEIINIDFFPDAQIFVFDRWRNIVFSHHGLYENDWDGTMNGKPLPIDTYHFIIKLDDVRDPVTGQVTILR